MGGNLFVIRDAKKNDCDFALQNVRTQFQNFNSEVDFLKPDLNIVLLFQHSQGKSGGSWRVEEGRRSERGVE